MISLTVPRSRYTRYFGLILASASLVTYGLRAETTPAPASTEPSIPRIAVGAEVGTTGYGPEVIFTLTSHFTANLAYTFLSFDRDFNDTDNDYKGKLKLSNFQAIANWHPFAGTFHLSAGAFASNNRLDATGQPKTGTYHIGDATYTAQQVGSITGKATIANGVIPYVGFGWSKTPANRGFGGFFDLGVALMDAPKIALSAQGGTLSSDPTLQAELRKEEAKVNDKLTPYKYYPVIKFGLLYRF